MSARLPVRGGQDPVRPLVYFAPRDAGPMRRRCNTSRILIRLKYKLKGKCGGINYASL